MSYIERYRSTFASEFTRVCHVNSTLLKLPNMGLPAGWFKDSDIRFSYGLGGGSYMDMGCKCVL